MYVSMQVYGAMRMRNHGNRASELSRPHIDRAGTI